MTTTATPKHRQPNAAQVSRALADAGLPKAGPYVAFGSRVEGFIVTREGDGAVYVLTTGSYRHRGRALSQIVSPRIERYAEVLEAAGYRVEVERTKSEDHAYAIKLLRWED
jgi:hypothetical protein